MFPAPFCTVGCAIHPPRGCFPTCFKQSQQDHALPSGVICLPLPPTSAFLNGPLLSAAPPLWKSALTPNLQPQYTLPLPPWQGALSQMALLNLQGFRRCYLISASLRAKTIWGYRREGQKVRQFAPFLPKPHIFSGHLLHGILLNPSW